MLLTEVGFVFRDQRTRFIQEGMGKNPKWENWGRRMGRMNMLTCLIYSKKNKHKSLHYEERRKIGREPVFSFPFSHFMFPEKIQALELEE